MRKLFILVTAMMMILVMAATAYAGGHGFSQRGQGKMQACVNSANSANRQECTYAGECPKNGVCDGTSMRQKGMQNANRVAGQGCVR